jgi:uncharacterized spore protein YtfJ
MGSNNNINDVVRHLLEGMHTMSKSETLVGEPIATKSGTLVPIHRLRVGFAAGSASGNAQASSRTGQTGGRGVGGTVQIDPVAVIAVGTDGTPRVLAVDGDADTALQRLVEQVPDLLVRAVRGIGERVVAARPELRAALEPKEEKALAAPASDAEPKKKK